MNLRSRLFATVAVPVLSAAVLVQPMTAAAVSSVQDAARHSVPGEQDASLLLAQAAVTCSDGSQADDQATCDAIDAQRAAEEQAAQEEAQRAAEQQAAEEEAQRAAEQQAAEEEAQRAAEQQAAEEEAQRAAEQQAAEEEAQRAAEQQAAEEAQRAAEQQAAEEEAQRAAEQQAAEEEAQRAAEQQAAEEEAQRAAEQQAAEEEAQRAAEQQAAEQEAQRAAEQQAAEEEAQRAAEQQAAEEAQKAAEEQQTQEMVTCADGSQAATADACPAAPVPQEEPAQTEAPAVEEAPAEQAPAEQAQPDEAPAEEVPADQAPADQTPTQEAPAEDAAPAEAPAEDAAPAEETPAEQAPDAQNQQSEQPAGEQTQDAAPDMPADNQDQSATEPTEEQPVEEVVVPAVEPPEDAPVVDVVDERSEEDKEKIAEDPASTAETVVLPVDNGAAVLDSDKDADNTGGADVREVRTELREETPVGPPPTSDADAQAEQPEIKPQVMEAILEEKGQTTQTAPTFEVPTTVINNVTNVNNVTNNVTNVTNVTNQTNIVNQVNEVRVIEEIDNRTIINIGNLEVVRSNDRPRLRYDEEQTYYEELSRGRMRETIERTDGSRLVTVYNRYGDIILRSRFTPRGEEYVLFYAPEADRDEARVYVDVGYSLPPMRLTIPVQDYIITTSRAPDRDYYDFLAQPPVERVERVYSIDEVKSSARLRDKVRRIDLDTITFPSGSAEVPLAQAKTLRKVAAAMEEILAKDPGETFLIEGHTDAVGSDRSNLILSDKRAETVANLLTEVYGIPPENLSVQGYGERFLKIRTAEAEQQNRRVAIRRVTSLVRPATASNR